MKRLLFLLTAGLLTTGCYTNSATDDGVDVDNGDSRMLTVSLAHTRISLGEKVGETYPIYWSEGDKIVVNGALSEEVEIDAENRSCAKFEVKTTCDYPYHITYPYCTTSAEQPAVEFPAEQAYTYGSFASGSIPMCGYLADEGDRVTLSHIATVLRLPVKAKHKEVKLAKIVVTSSEKIAGTFEVDCQKAEIEATDDCVNSIVYTLPAEYTLSTTTESVFYISLPAIYVGNCTIEFIETTNSKMVATWSPSESLPKGIVREFKTLLYESNTSTSLPTFNVTEDDFVNSKKYANSNEIKIMSFNVRMDTSESDPTNNWVNRKAACVELIKDHKPSIIGFQEAKYTSQWLYLKEQLADSYDGYGVNRDTGKESGTGEVMGILYNKSVIEKIDGGTFWLSETPDTPSKGFGANHSRNATWGIFRHLPSGEIFYYINTHLDHKVSNARIEGMKLISQHFEEYKDSYPLFLTGDLNITSSNVAIDVIEGYMYNAREVAPILFTDFDTTFNGYDTTKNSIIDHIYCSNNLSVVAYHTVDEQYGNVAFVSDHYPIYAIINIRK